MIGLEEQPCKTANTKKYFHTFFIQGPNIISYNIKILKLFAS